MIKKLLFLLLILISVQAFAKIGINPDFWIISQQDYNNRVSKGRDVVLKRYIIVPDFDKKYKDVFVTKDEDAILSMFSYMLYKGKNSMVEKYIANYDPCLKINTLIVAMYHFSKKQYSQSLAYLATFDDKKYNFLKLLLIADCNYELLYSENNKNPVVKLYQNALDMAETEQFRALVNNRIKFIKYR